MPTDTAFDTGWLETRFPHDARARNPEVERACLQYCGDFNPLRILDIGAGTGSSFLYLTEKMPDQQYWTLVELNPQLLKAARERIVKWAEQYRYNTISTAEGLQLQKGKKSIELAFRHQSFLELSGLLSTAQFHLVTAAAVFDLLSAAMFRELAQQLMAHDIALLATLNYRSMAFLPQSREDKKYVEAYEAHMLRPQPFGQSMGPGCCREMIRFYRERQKPLSSGPSSWNIAASDKAMLAFMLHFMERSIGEKILTEEKGKSKFNHWMREKRRQAAEEELSLLVHHCDIFTF